jgi:hypothetical protein
MQFRILTWNWKFKPFYSVVDSDPDGSALFWLLGFGSGSLLEMRIRIQDKGNWPKLTNKSHFQPLKKTLYLRRNVLWHGRYFYVKIQLLVSCNGKVWQRSGSAWIRVGLLPGSDRIRMELKSWIRIRINTEINAIPTLIFYIQKFMSSRRYVLLLVSPVLCPSFFYGHIGYHGRYICTIFLLNF